MRPSSRRSFVRSIAGGTLLTTIASGKQPESIFLSPEASPSEMWAAAELSFWLGRMTGLKPGVVSGKNVPDNLRTIAVGRSAITDRFGIEVPEGESFLLKTVRETVIIAGGRGRGTMYGVFRFLEKLGFRWYTADVTRVPHGRPILVPPLDEISRPAFEYREVFFSEAQGKEWSARNGLNGNFHQLDASVGGRIFYAPFAHSFYDLVPPSRFFESHPEYFALVQGKRRGERAQLCLTNDEVLRLAVSGVHELLVEHPDASVISVSQNDGAGWCECDRCQQAIREEGGAVSGLLLRFVNQVAASHPGKTIGTLAYQDTADPPSKVRPLPNVQIRLCPVDACQAHSYQTCVYNRRSQERLSQWARIAPKLYLWQYSINFAHYLAPFPNERELIADIPQFRKAGVQGIFVEGAVSEGGGGEDAELRAYLAARLLWNPETDAAAEIRGFLNEVYGPAAPFMRRYLDLRQREVDRGQHLWMDQNVDAPYLTNGFLKEAREALNRASQKAANEPAERRIGRHLLSLDYVETLRSRRCILQGASYGPRDASEVRRNTQGLVRRAEALGITHFREGYPLTEQARDWDEAVRNYPAVVLSDGAMAVTVVPELGARIVEMRRDGGSANVLRVADPGELRYPNVGGLYFSLGSGYLGNAQSLTWNVKSVAQSRLVLTGQSVSGLNAGLEIKLDGGALAMNFKVANPGSQTLPVLIRCQTEFVFGPSRKAMLLYTDKVGVARSRPIEEGDRPEDGVILATGDNLPLGQWTLSCPDSALQITNRFRVDEVARTSLRWSFRGATQLTMAVWSPEVELRPGQELSLGSESMWAAAPE